jgi:hypothetical protein
MRSALKATAAVVVGSLLLASTAQAGGWRGGHSGGHGGYYGGYYGHHHYGSGLGIALGVTGAIIGTAIIADALTRPRTAYVVEPPPAYYPAPPAYYPPPAAYYPPPAPYPSAAYEEGYRAGLADAHSYPRQWERRDAQYSR